jgi:hypothetical protein
LAEYIALENAKKLGEVGENANIFVLEVVWFFHGSFAFACTL